MAKSVNPWSNRFNRWRQQPDFAGAEVGLYMAHVQTRRVDGGDDVTIGFTFRADIDNRYLRLGLPRPHSISSARMPRRVEFQQAIRSPIGLY